VASSAGGPEDTVKREAGTTSALRPRVRRLSSPRSEGRQDGSPTLQIPLLSKPVDLAAPKPLLKWIGSKHRVAVEIVSYLPESFGTYFEPFLGSGAMLGTLAPTRAVGSDYFKPLMEIWQTLSKSADTLKEWYAERRKAILHESKTRVYDRVKKAYNTNPNGADLLFICRTCYGGVVRFRKDGYLSTPCGTHDPIPTKEFSRRVDDWKRRTRGTTFLAADFERVMDMVARDDLVYCDPPYSHSQSILYGAQAFELTRLFDTIARCKARGAYVALSIDGTKRSGDMVCNVPIPIGLFEREIFVKVGRSMLKRFQMGGRSLEKEVVADRLLLTY